MRIQLFTSRLLMLSCVAFGIQKMQAQITFSNSNTSLHSDVGAAGSNANSRSGNAVCVVDMNYDGLDDICKLADNGEVRIEYQQPGGTFTYQYVGSLATTGAWAMCAADVDKNGYKDVIAGYGSSLKIMKINATGSMGVTTLPNSSFFVQNVNFMDVNGDGWIDIYACDDNAYSKLYLNNGSGSYPSEAGNTVINFDVTSGQNVGTSNDDSGNYGSVWTDFDNDGDVDLYVAHCRQSVSSGTDPRRIDQVFVNNGSNVFTEAAASHGLASGDQDWTASFGDIDNDSDFDLFLTKHNTTSKLYTNNGTGNFTVGSALAFGSMPMQSQFEDLDNDGFVDLIITGDNDHRIYKNNGTGGFTDVTPSGFTVSGSNLLSFATGDLNHDGKIDIYGSYGSTYNNPGSKDDVYWKNTTSNGNHFLTLVMLPSLTNNDALGTRAFIYGSWGVQTREVRAGESYGTLNSAHLHFGLGTATTVDSIVVKWPSGIETVITNPGIDQFLNVSEQNPCTLSGASVSPSGSVNICSGDSVTLTATTTGTGYTYLWSTGETTQSIVVTAAGSYAVTVTESTMCNATSPSVQITYNGSETPTVTASSTDLTFCEGGTVTLTSTPAASYLWSNGDTTQSTVIGTSGNYYVTIQGACQTWNSDTTAVNVLAAAAVPAGSDVIISTPQSVTLNATGTNNAWFDAAVGGNQIGTGNSFTTGIITQDTTFYVEDQTSYGGSSANVGMKYHSGSSYSGSTATNAYTIFNVINPCTLNTVKVYTDTPGNRIVELRNSSGTVINSLTVNLTADTSIVTLNFPLTPGNGYQLGTNSAANQTLLGYNSPRLKRSSSNVVYPYNLANLVDIVNSSQGTTVYYYFYDWNVTEPPMVCPSPRHPQSVLFSVTGISEVQNSSVNIFPNPASGEVNIIADKDLNANTSVELTDLTGRTVLAQKIAKTAKGQKITLSLQNVAQGAYFLKVTNSETKIIRKLIVE
jgi:hypothetical protein